MMTSTSLLRSRSHRPVLDLDLYSRAALLHPERVYRAIRDVGSAVWLPRHNSWVMGRFADVQAALRSSDVYVSGHGVRGNAVVNRLTRKTTIASDGRVHERRRKVLMNSLTVKALAPP